MDDAYTHIPIHTTTTSVIGLAYASPDNARSPLIQLYRLACSKKQQQDLLTNEPGPLNHHTNRVGRIENENFLFWLKTQLLYRSHQVRVPLLIMLLQ